ncbi:MAG: hypothetical protein FGM33_09700 [Candidatus Kapabacteria bacterium]|nr:hypothetical protein [Candidatus Kapabacteria bacterium]
MARWVASRHDSTLSAALTAATTGEAILSLPDGPSIIVVPTSAQRPHLLRQWLLHHPQRPAPLVMTMAQLIRRLGGEHIEAGPRILHESAVTVLLRHAAASQPSVLSLGLSAETLVRWTQHDLSPGDLDQSTDASSDVTRMQRIRHEAALVWRALEQTYGWRGCDRGSYARLLVEALSQRTETGFPHSDGRYIHRLLVVETHGLTPVDRRLLMRLAETGWDIGVRFCDEPDRGESDLPQSTTESDVQVLVSAGWHHGGDNGGPVPEDIELVTCDSRTDEVRMALTMLRDDIMAGHSMADLCICLPGSTSYRRLLDHQAPLYGVPLQMTLQRRAATTRIGAAISAACQVVTGGWQRIDLQRLLAEPLAESLRSMGATDLMDIARRDRIRGGDGADQWLERLEWGLQSLMARDGQQDDGTVPDVWSRDRTVRSYERARLLIARLQSSLSIESTTGMSGADFAAFVADSVIGQLRLDVALEKAVEAGSEHAGAPVVDVEVVAFEKIRQSLTLYASLSQDHELAALTFTEHVNAWWGMVEQINIDVGNNRAGVTVAGPAELRGRTFRRLIVLGFIDGEFPRSSGSFFDEELLPQVARRLDVEAMADCMSAANGGVLCLLRPRMIDDTLTIPSTFATLVPTARHADHPKPPVIFVGHSDTADATPYRPPQDVVIGSSEGGEHEFEIERTRRMSASRLDVMTKCPFAYLATKVLRLDVTSLDDARLTPLERGNVMHELIAEFFRRVQPSEPLTFVTRQEILSRRVELHRSMVETYWSVLCGLVDEYAQRHAWEHTYAVAERQALVGSPGRAGLLRRWLELEIEYQAATGFAPALFELELEEDLIIDDQGAEASLPVTARIDRIDVRGTDDGIDFIVNDYKPRAKDFSMNSVVDARLSQMPLYIKAFSTWLTRHGVPCKPLAAIYRSFGASIHETEEPQNKVVLFDPDFKTSAKSPALKFAQVSKMIAELQDQTLRSQVDRILPQLLPLREQITSGRFPVRPTKEACNGCRMSEFCRIRQWGEATAEHQGHHL